MDLSLEDQLYFLVHYSALRYFGAKRSVNSTTETGTLTLNGLQKFNMHKKCCVYRRMDLIRAFYMYANTVSDFKG